MSSDAKKIAETQKKMDEVKIIMTNNVNKMLQNNDKIECLDNKILEMTLESSKFKRTTSVLSRLQRWRNIKLWPICIAVFMVLSITFIILIFIRYS